MLDEMDKLKNQWEGLDVGGGGGGPQWQSIGPAGSGGGMTMGGAKGRFRKNSFRRVTQTTRIFNGVRTVTF